MASVKRILVTGGAGFLGSHLCDRLVAAGHDVVCVDNFYTSQKSNVAHLLGQGNFELIRHDIIHPLWLEVDEIYNLACPAAPGHYQFNPIKTLKTSVIGSINVLGMARRCRAKVLQASTSEVYGDPEVHPQPESYRGAVNPIGPRACYDEGKRAAETLFMDYHRANGVNVRIVRIFNTYGPRMHPYDGRVVSTFIRQAVAAAGRWTLRRAALLAVGLFVFAALDEVTQPFFPPRMAEPLDWVADCVGIVIGLLSIALVVMVARRLRPAAGQRQLGVGAR